MIVFAFITILCTCICIANGKENYCPGDEDELIPSHSSQSNWPGWHCRRHTMSYKGNLDTLKSIDFQAIENANKTILRIRLRNREIAEIPLNILQPLQSLKQLDLDLNATQLTPHIFDTLTNLQHLSIYTNQERIPQNIFAHLGNLKYLKLHIRARKSRLKPHQRECKEYAIPKSGEGALNEMVTTELFRPLKQLQYLYLSCQCQTIPGKMLRYQSLINTLILNVNTSKLPSNLFQGMYDLNSLHIKSRKHHIILPQRLFYHLRSLQTLDIESKSVYLASNIFQYTKNLNMLSFNAILENVNPNLFESLPELYLLDLGSTQIASLPPTLIHNNTDLRHLRLESNNIRDIPLGFFKHSAKLSSLILDHNQIKSLDAEIFYPLKSLTDIHLQHNIKFEMYCDFGLGNSSLFPKLRAVFMHGMAHKCIQNWTKHLQESRGDLEIHIQETDESLKLCKSIQIQHLPNSVQYNTSLLLQFKGPHIFIKHKAYWISHSVHKCSDFRKITNFKSQQIGHEQVAINDDGKCEFVFTKKGKYFLVYQYGHQPFIPYYDYMINVV